jgi:hypothetical protein
MSEVQYDPLGNGRGGLRPPILKESWNENPMIPEVSMYTYKGRVPKMSRTTTIFSESVYTNANSPSILDNVVLSDLGFDDITMPHNESCVTPSKRTPFRCTRGVVVRSLALKKYIYEPQGFFNILFKHTICDIN